MKVLEPNPVAASFRDAVRRQISEEQLTINIVGILASSDPASITYADYTRAGCEDVGIHFDLKTCEPESVRAVLEEANRDSAVHGIFVYYPIWGDERDAELRDLISPHKDVEGLSPHWIGKLYANERFDAAGRRFKAILPCTPLAIIKLLEATDAYQPYGLPFGAQQITIFNRSEVVGRPLAYMLSNDGARVYSFDINGGFVVDVNSSDHEARPVSRQEALRQSDVVITGVPSPHFEKVRAGELKPGAICLNFSYIQNFEPEAKEAASLYIPRVGPMTVAMCMRNALQLYRNYHHEA
ncbi:bifunctional methylenetetrahydrofolate dehydrogenase/methenyltetrahydrofolate cyclohydrolase [Chlorobaculum sp. 24CR]|uniref:bifunctional methylenetetrahydrofolate dehydrogenase/methenyltetrahydrofolate cyclohydrolase n=1 Tax=Chlorobaculum sp. 24CR TaxID=2508878 RepID=UPI00100C1228|nr:bifunctional methylenetetrahydrofolate dehydrogenase/methenyltetrahydrofolate cyclohydrolase [Chlorobaculum sp. 24CR]RXK88923.1 bifunctional methylenetetrahydrofolate dehydrogenase/methenyltetrahydrofolate cyclohydrolase [Chlorobaculum sp. 24CR]